MGKTLVWHQGALGDLILSLPAIYAVKTGRKPGYLHLISRTDIADIVIENRLADAVSSHENGLFVDFFMRGDVSQRAAGFLKKFTSAFIFAKKTDDGFVENLRRYIPECFFIGTRPGDGRAAHVSAAQLEQLRGLGIAAEEMPPLDAISVSSAVHGERPVVAIHPGSGGRTKCWPADKFFELMRSLDSEKRYYFHLILGPAEGRELDKTASRFVAANQIDASVISGMSVAAVASLLKSSSLYVGNDSGITHLASALGVPTLAVFGPTDPEIWGPLGGNARIFYSGYPCSPCTETDRRLCPDVQGLETVKVCDLLAAAKDVLSRRAF